VAATRSDEPQPLEELLRLRFLDIPIFLDLDVVLGGPKPSFLA